MNRRTARGNRIGLAVVGLILLAAGAYALARGLAAGPELLGSAHAPLTDRHLRSYPASQSWFWPVAAVVTVIITLLALRWLAVQARTDAVGDIALETSPRQGTTRLPARALTDALEDDLTASPYVQRVNAILTGPAAARRLALTVTLTTGSDPATVAQRTSQALERLRHAHDAESLTATVRLRTQ